LKAESGHERTCETEGREDQRRELTLTQSSLQDDTVERP
jgi:hypothetical protein